MSSETSVTPCGLTYCGWHAGSCACGVDAGIYTEYAAIRYGSTPDNSRYVKRDGQILGAVCRASDGTWIAYGVEQILDMCDSIAHGLLSMSIAIAAVANR